MNDTTNVNRTNPQHVVKNRPVVVGDGSSETIGNDGTSDKPIQIDDDDDAHTMNEEPTSEAVGESIATSFMATERESTAMDTIADDNGVDTTTLAAATTAAAASSTRTPTILNNVTTTTNARSSMNDTSNVNRTSAWRVADNRPVVVGDGGKGSDGTSNKLIQSHHDNDDKDDALTTYMEPTSETLPGRIATSLKAMATKTMTKVGKFSGVLTKEFDQITTSSKDSIASVLLPFRGERYDVVNSMTDKIHWIESENHSYKAMATNAIAEINKFPGILKKEMDQITNTSKDSTTSTLAFVDERSDDCQRMTEKMH
jgi:flagellar hook-basal body complex protein FliE